jgi:hypothetical protein
MKHLSAVAFALLIAILSLSAANASVKHPKSADEVAIEETTLEGAQPIESDRRQLSWLLGFFTTRKFWFLNQK